MIQRTIHDSALTRNIRARRGEKVNIQVPTFQDTATTLPPTIHMDAMGFGMGSCCLQVTFQAEGLQESRLLYDQLVVIAPLVVGDEIVVSCRWLSLHIPLFIEECSLISIHDGVSSVSRLMIELQKSVME